MPKQSSSVVPSLYIAGHLGQRTVDQAVKDELCRRRLADALAAGEADLAAGNVVVGIDAAFDEADRPAASHGWNGFHAPELVDVAPDELGRLALGVHEVAHTHDGRVLERDARDARPHLVGEHACREGAAVVAGRRVRQRRAVRVADALSPRFSPRGESLPL